VAQDARTVGDAGVKLETALPALLTELPLKALTLTRLHLEALTELPLKAPTVLPLKALTELPLKALTGLPLQALTDLPLRVPTGKSKSKFQPTLKRSLRALLMDLRGTASRATVDRDEIHKN
jgi:hypothetical protein